LLEHKDSSLAFKLRDYRRVAAYYADASQPSQQPNTTITAVTPMPAADLDSKYIHNFENVLQLFLERGGVGFLELDCVFFAWDQGFIAGEAVCSVITRRFVLLTN
jgi:hypothetical protein